MVIFVSSSPSSFKRRETIRQTWAKNARDKGVLVLFFIGSDLTGTADMDKNIINEYRKYKDIIHDTVVDDFHQQTVKVLRMMKYYLKQFVNNKKSSTSTTTGPPLFIKADEDVQINLDKLLSPKMLKTFGFNKESGTFEGRIIGGTQVYMARPDRNSSSKYYMPHGIYAKNLYPPYVSGAFYTMTSPAVLEIYQRSLNLEYFPFEDIFLTGIVGNYLCRANIVHLYEVHHDIIIHPTNTLLDDKERHLAYRIPLNSSLFM